MTSLGKSRWSSKWIGSDCSLTRSWEVFLDQGIIIPRKSSSRQGPVISLWIPKGWAQTWSGWATGCIQWGLTLVCLCKVHRWPTTGTCTLLKAPDIHWKSPKAESLASQIRLTALNWKLDTLLDQCVCITIVPSVVGYSGFNSTARHSCKCLNTTSFDLIYGLH